MPFQITALPAELFAGYFAMDEAELARHGALRRTANASPGFPCRVSLRDADPGETVLLIGYEHQPALTPYRARHAIYVRETATQAHPAAGEIPLMLRSRMISVRHFDVSDRMVGAAVVPGAELEAALQSAFANPDVGYLHLHFAAPGCFAAQVHRA